MGHVDPVRPGHDQPRHSQRLRWILDSLAILAPGTVLMAPCPLAFLVGPDSVEDPRFIPILDPVRVGRRLILFEVARKRALEAGIRLAVRGTAGEADGFDLRMVSADRIGECPGGGTPLVCIDIATPDQLSAARSAGAEWLAGPAVAPPLRIAPVDISRLRR